MRHRRNSTRSGRTTPAYSIASCFFNIMIWGIVEQKYWSSVCLKDFDYLYQPLQFHSTTARKLMFVLYVILNSRTTPPQNIDIEGISVTALNYFLTQQPLLSWRS